MSSPPENFISSLTKPTDVKDVILDQMHNVNNYTRDQLFGAGTLEGLLIYTATAFNLSNVDSEKATVSGGYAFIGGQRFIVPSNVVSRGGAGTAGYFLVNNSGTIEFVDQGSYGAVIGAHAVIAHVDIGTTVTYHRVWGNGHQGMGASISVGYDAGAAGGLAERIFTISGKATVLGDLALSSGLILTGNADLNGTLDVALTSLLQGVVTMSVGAVITTGGLTVSDGGFDVLSGSTFNTIHDGAGLRVISDPGGTPLTILDVQAAQIIVTGDLTVTGATNIGTMNIGDEDQLSFGDSQDTVLEHSTDFKSGDVGAQPLALGLNNTYSMLFITTKAQVDVDHNVSGFPASALTIPTIGMTDGAAPAANKWTIYQHNKIQTGSAFGFTLASGSTLAITSGSTMTQTATGSLVLTGASGGVLTLNNTFVLNGVGNSTVTATGSLILTGNTGGILTLNGVFSLAGNGASTISTSSSTLGITAASDLTLTATTEHITLNVIGTSKNIILQEDSSPYLNISQSGANAAFATPSNIGFTITTAGTGVIGLATVGTGIITISSAGTLGLSSGGDMTHTVTGTNFIVNVGAANVMTITTSAVTLIRSLSCSAGIAITTGNLVLTSGEITTGNGEVDNLNIAAHDHDGTTAGGVRVDFADVKLVSPIMQTISLAGLLIKDGANNWAPITAVGGPNVEQTTISTIDVPVVAWGAGETADYIGIPLTIPYGCRSAKVYVVCRGRSGNSRWSAGSLDWNSISSWAGSDVVTNVPDSSTSTVLTHTYSSPTGGASYLATLRQTDDASYDNGLWLFQVYIMFEMGYSTAT